MRTQSKVCGFWGCKLVGKSRDDGGVVGEKETEDLIADFARELEEAERHCQTFM